MNALERINTLPSLGESTNSRNPCSPEIASERGWDRVCSGITRGEIIWLFLLPVIYYLLHKYADVQTFNYNIYLKSIKKSLVNFYKFYVFISLRVCVCVSVWLVEDIFYQ